VKWVLRAEHRPAVIVTNAVVARSRPASTSFTVFAWNKLSCPSRSRRAMGALGDRQLCLQTDILFVWCQSVPLSPSPSPPPLPPFSSVVGIRRCDVSGP
jgi:hypothetical protein